MMIEKSTWKEMILAQMKHVGETIVDIESSDPPLCSDMMNKDVILDYGGDTWDKFFVHTKNFVYFAHYYDGYPSVHRVPRNPITINKTWSIGE